MSTEVVEIAYPEVRIRNGHKREYKKLIDNFFTSYNDGKPGREQLKAPHKQMLLELVFYAHIVVERDSKLLREDGLFEIKPGSFVKVNLNRFVLANEIRRSPDTIKRYKKRLADAGAILVSQEDFDKHKINKGGRNHVLINPDLMLIYDRFNPDFQPTSPFLSETEIQGLRQKKSANCIGVSGTVTLPDQINNEIMDVQNVDKGVNQIDNSTRTNPNKTLPEATPKLNGGGAEMQGNSHENAEKSAETPQQNPNKSSARKLEAVDNSTPPRKRDKVADLKRMFALELYALMVRFLFKDHNIYKGEARQAVNYIEKVYFSTLRDQEHGEYMMKCYSWRVEKAADYIQKHNFDFSNIYPVHYLDIHNKKGFAATYTWYHKHRATEARKAKNRIVNGQKLLEKQLLQQAIDRVKENPSLYTFRQTMQEVQSKIPNLSYHFVEAVSQQINS
jgi:hypothetical protein